MFLVGDLVSLDLLARLALASLLWVLFQHLIRFHPRGIEIVGGILCFLGFSWWLSNPVIVPPFGAILLLVGLFVYGVGRTLYRIRNTRRTILAAAREIEKKRIDS